MNKTVGYLVIIAACLALAIHCSPPAADGDGDSDGDADGGGDDCTDGEERCRGIALEECVDGAWADGECDGICVDGIGCAACDPGSRYCDENTVMECRDDGSGGDVVTECNPDEGYECSGGFCTNACDEAMENRSNLGCEYWAVDLDNAENAVDNASAGTFAVAVANPDPYLSAHVVAEINNAPFGEALDLEIVMEVDVGPRQLEILELPRRDADGDSTRNHVDEGPQSLLSSRAFRITSGAPVVSYQFNTIDQRFSNDASLLLPTSGLDNHHIVLGYPPANAVVVPGLPFPPSRAYVTILGTEEETVVTVTPSFEILEGGGIPSILAGEEYEVTIGPFDVINLETVTVPFGQAIGGRYPDLTGTIVESSKPVAVFFGTDLSVVGPEEEEEYSTEDSSCCAEHLESQILPTSAMGTSFAVNRSPWRSATGSEVDTYRVLAVVDGTTVTTNLEGVAASFSLNAGEFFRFDSNRPFVLESNEGHPVHVGQFLVSQGYTEQVIGDPSFLMFPAVEEWRGVYLFTTGRNFSEDYVSIVMPQGAAVTLDGVDVLAGLCDAAVDVGELDGVHFVQVICDIEDGVHEVDSGDTTVGVTAYGYYSAGSYAYSAGSELTRIFLI